MVEMTRRPESSVEEGSTGLATINLSPLEGPKVL